MRHIVLRAVATDQMTRFWARSFVIAIFYVLVLSLTCIVSVWFSERDAAAQPPFYQATEQDIAGSPGTLIRQEPMPFFGGKAFRILYRSTGLHD